MVLSTLLLSISMRPSVRRDAGRPSDDVFQASPSGDLAAARALMCEPCFHVRDRGLLACRSQARFQIKPADGLDP
jgi:hypothetical protein